MIDFSLLLDRQKELEDNAMSMGSQRFRKRLETAQQSGKASTVGAARKLVQNAIQPLEVAIQDMMALAKRTPGKRHVAVQWIDKLTKKDAKGLVVVDGAKVAAYMTVKVVLDGLAKRVSLRKAAFSITEMIVDEIRYRRFEEVAPQLFKYKMRTTNTASYAHAARSMNASIHYADIDTTDLDLVTSQRLLLGTKLIDLLMETTGMIELASQKVGMATRKQVKTEHYLVPSVETTEWMTARNAALEFFWPVNLPMIVPPLPWAQGQRGGYRFALRNKHDLVRGTSRKHQRTVANTDMPRVYQALNRLQETAWQINTDVLDLLQVLARRGGGLGGVPSTEEEPLPRRPDDIATNKDSRRLWRRAASKVRERNHQRAMRALEFTKVLSTALSVCEEDVIFFPYNLDFRGRIYPVTNFLNPQGDDMAKALLRFAQGKPLGEDGADWLAIHGANCLGDTPEGQKVSKLTLQERVDYIVAHTAEIERVAEDPMTHTWWAKADDPLLFYAFCLEWAGYATLARQGRGPEFVSRVPVSMDGSCNGLQHFSAMLRDEVGGKAVNVFPNERPHDIYQKVADHVLAQLEALAGDEDFAAKWLTSGLVNRKLCKRPTMTFGYGSKRFGFQEQIGQDLLSRENAKDILKHFLIVGEDGKETNGVYQAARLMSGLIWEALRVTVVAAFGGMAWMQLAARGVASTGNCVEWTVPATGFRVRQEYFEDTKRQIKTVLAGRIIQPTYHEQTDKVNGRKQANAVSPNFVHSLDAAALMLTIEAASTDGVEHFAMIHDSYGTLAADAGVLARCTRQAFYRLYTERDVIEEFAGQLKAQTKNPEEFPAVSAHVTRGTLDLAGVLVSDYFFA